MVAAWSTFSWVFVLGVIGGTTLGIAYSSLGTARSVGAVVIGPMLVLQFISGVYFAFSDIPSWMQQIASAFLDVTTPEPLPADDPLWSLDNAHITMHLSGRAQDKMFVRSAQRFLENLERWHNGAAVEPRVDLTLGY